MEAIQSFNKIIIFPDIHGRTFWNEVNLKEYDKAIFLGDYVDPYPEEGIDADAALNNFKEIIKLNNRNPNKIAFLLGNHDLHYMFDNFVTSTRYSKKNATAYSQLFNANKNLFNLAYQCSQNGKEYLFTHAGLVIEWFERNMDIMETDYASADALNKLLTVPGGIQSLSELSFYRGGLYNEGSIVWSDVREKLSKNHREITDFYQIFGHTMLKEGCMIDNKYWACIDCQRPVSLIDNKLTIL